MIGVKTTARIGPDGTLTVQPLPASEATPATPTPEELGWPPVFFEATAGALRDDPMERLPQGDYEVREELEPSW